MNIDNALMIMIDKIRAENLHIARQDDEIYIVVFQQFELPAFLLLLVALIDRQIKVIDAETLGDRRHVFVITDYQRYFRLPFSGFIARKNVVKTMRQF